MRKIKPISAGPRIICQKHYYEISACNVQLILKFLQISYCKLPRYKYTANKFTIFWHTYMIMVKHFKYPYFVFYCDNAIHVNFEYWMKFKDFKFIKVYTVVNIGIFYIFHNRRSIVNFEVNHPDLVQKLTTVLNVWDERTYAMCRAYQCAPTRSGCLWSLELITSYTGLATVSYTAFFLCTSVLEHTCNQTTPPKSRPKHMDQWCHWMPALQPSRWLLLVNWNVCVHTVTTFPIIYWEYVCLWCQRWKIVLYLFLCYPKALCTYIKQ